MMNTLIEYANSTGRSLGDLGCHHEIHLFWSRSPAARYRPADPHVAWRVVATWRGPGRRPHAASFACGPIGGPASRTKRPLRIRAPTSPI